VGALRRSLWKEPAARLLYRAALQRRDLSHGSGRWKPALRVPFPLVPKLRVWERTLLLATPVARWAHDVSHSNGTAAVQFTGGHRPPLQQCFAPTSVAFNNSLQRECQSGTELCPPRTIVAGAVWWRRGSSQFESTGQRAPRQLTSRSPGLELSKSLPAPLADKTHHARLAFQRVIPCPVAQHHQIMLTQPVVWLSFLPNPKGHARTIGP
jgi:hypothetical protein